MEFEWDEAKHQSNLERQGLDFEDAGLVFTDEAYVTEDTRQDYDEKRFILLGPLFERLVIIVFTVRDERIRIISMRKANQREQEYYTQKRLRTDGSDAG